MSNKNGRCSFWTFFKTSSTPSAFSKPAPKKGVQLNRQTRITYIPTHHMAMNLNGESPPKVVGALACLKIIYRTAMGSCESLPRQRQVWIPPALLLPSNHRLVVSILRIHLPLKTPSPGEVFIFYRHIAHVTPKKLRKVVFLGGKFMMLPMEIMAPFKYGASSF